MNIMNNLCLAIGLLLFTSACAAGQALPASPHAVESTLPPQPTRASAPLEQKAGVSKPLLPEEDPPAGASEFKTNFKKHTVPYREILSGGPPKDGIPAIDEPRFVSVAEARVWLKDNEPVILYQNNGDVRAYPLQILIWHEIVNDTVGGKAVAVTFCPLCNTSIVFDRVVAGETTTFGTTGRLRYSDLVMYDRATETWWQQASGEAIAGDYTGMRLTFLPSQVVSFGDFRSQYPAGRVLSRETGFSRPYGTNPYLGYDDPDNVPFLYQGPATPGVLRLTDYVVTLVLDATAVAYPWRVLAEKRVINDVVANRDIVVFWKSGMSSALDALTIAQGRDIGATGVFERRLNDRVLTFVAHGENFRDVETGTTWNILGQGIKGLLAGQQLTPLVHGNHFWFAWAAFRPDTKLYPLK